MRMLFGESACPLLVITLKAPDAKGKETLHESADPDHSLVGEIRASHAGVQAN